MIVLIISDHHFLLMRIVFVIWMGPSSSFVLLPRNAIFLVACVLVDVCLDTKPKLAFVLIDTNQVLLWILPHLQERLWQNWVIFLPWITYKSHDDV